MKVYINIYIGGAVLEYESNVRMGICREYGQEDQQDRWTIKQ